MEDRPTDSAIIEAVLSAAERAGLTHVTKKALSHKTRESDTVICRHLLCYIMCKHYGLTTMRVGKHINRDHSSIVYGYNTIVHRIGLEYHVGRTYQYACEALGLEPAIKPMIDEPVIKPVEKESGAYVVPKNYTKKELLERQQKLKYPGVRATY